LEWPADPAGEEVARQFHRYLAQFALTGDPNGSALPEWPRYAPSTDVLLDFTAAGGAVAERDPWHERLDLVGGVPLGVQP
jgi:para-nitrobenzyl esterase